MSKQAEKTKNQTTKTLTLNRALVVAICIIIGAITVVVVPLVHIEMPVETSEVKEYRISLEAENEKLLNDQNSTKDDVEALKKENDTKLKSFIDDQRIFGWKSPRKFWIAFGIRLPYLIFAITFTLLVFLLRFFLKKNGIKISKNLSKSLRSSQVLFYAAAIYHVGWVFWALDQDYPPKTYWYYYILCSLIVAYLVTHSFKWYKGKLQLMQEKIDRMLLFLLEIRDVHYKEVLRKAIKKDLYNETYQEELKKDTNDFKNRLHEEAKEFVGEDSE